MNKYDLEERLIEFAVLSLGIANSLPVTAGGQQLAFQLSKSGTSPALNYGEAQSAESRRDFIHKIKIILKELRETGICLKIISRSFNSKETSRVESAIREADELISIFVKSVKTAQENLNSERSARNIKNR